MRGWTGLQSQLCSCHFTRHRLVALCMAPGAPPPLPAKLFCRQGGGDVRALPTVCESAGSLASREGEGEAVKVSEEGVPKLHHVQQPARLHESLVALRRCQASSAASQATRWAPDLNRLRPEASGIRAGSSRGAQGRNGGAVAPCPTLKRRARREPVGQRRMRLLKVSSTTADSLSAMARQVAASILPALPLSAVASAGEAPMRQNSNESPWLAASGQCVTRLTCGASKF